MKIDLKKPLICKNGKEVTILSTKGYKNKNFPIVGEVSLDDNNSLLLRWSLEGVCYAGEEFDISNPVETRKVLVLLCRNKSTNEVEGEYINNASNLGVRGQGFPNK